jgi:3-methyladenine DNA glycosylase/8-oxoguanine DNA glycosylase
MSAGSATSRIYQPTGPFSLFQTAAPVAWGKGRWPNVDWIDSRLIWVGWEGNALAVRVVEQGVETGSIAIDGPSDPARDRPWLDAMLGFSRKMPAFTDPTIAPLAAEMAGLRPFANGSLFEGVIGSIVGQSISVAAAATTERRLAALAHEGLDLAGRIFFPAPRPDDLARLSVEAVRSTGVTWRRAEAIVAIARLHEAGGFPHEPSDDAAIERTLAELRALPLVGPWTARSALLWGIGAPDVHPIGDVALLRAARQAYGNPALTMKELDLQSDRWRPGRSWAARLLWTNLLGVAV